VLRRMAQLTVAAIVVASAFPHIGAGLRVVAAGAAVVGLVVLAFGLALRPVINGLRPLRRDERRDWPFN
jgi:hypothetical protein